jgi:hypothetical protein
MLKTSRKTMLVVLSLTAVVALLSSACGNSPNSSSAAAPRVQGATTTSTLPPLPATLAARLARTCTDFATSVSATDPILDPVAKAKALHPIVAKLHAMLQATRVPAASAPMLTSVTASIADAGARLGASSTPATATAALAAFERDIDAAGLALLGSGVNCLGNAEGLRNSDLNVQLEGDSWLLSAADGSLWVSEKYLGRVVRVDPHGKVLARIDVGPNPAKSFPLDGNLWVRTQTGFTEIDMATNAVVGRTPYTRFGRATMHSWGADGRVWLCDGGTLVHIDPSSKQIVARIGLPFTCFEAYAKGDVVLAWSNDNLPTESGNQQVAVIDPSTNVVRRSLHLSADVDVPAVTGGQAFFVGDNNDTETVIDVHSGAVVRTSHLPAKAGGYALAGGGFVWVPTADGLHVLRIDPSSGKVTARVDPVGGYSVAVLDGALWTVASDPLNLLQRFDLDKIK